MKILVTLVHFLYLELVLLALVLLVSISISEAPVDSLGISIIVSHDY